MQNHNSKLKNIIEDAEKRKIAVGHFNIGNFEQFKAITQVARRLDLPVIIGVSEGEGEYLDIHQTADLVKSYNREHETDNHRIFLNADHTRSLEKAKEAVLAGFDAILFDGGKLSLAENIKQTGEAVKIAKAINPDILVEGELGYIGSGSEILKQIPEDAAIKPEDLTKPEEAIQFVKETGIDLLAPAVGNVHGMLANAKNPNLNIKRIRVIKEAVKIPLVLHGGSGISDNDFRAAIEAGISIIHISTELRAAWRKGMEESLKDNPDEIAPYKISTETISEMEKVIEEKLRLFNKL